MPGQEQPDLPGSGQVTQLGQATQVITEVPVAGDDRGAAAEHRVAGEQRAVRGQQQADRVGGVARAGRHPELAPGRGDHIAVREPFRSQPVRRVGRLDRRPGQRGEPCRPGGMIRVTVRQQDPRHPAVARDRRRVHPAQVTLVVGPGIYHHDGG